MSQASAGKCLVPCRMKMYRVKEVGLQEIQNIRGLKIRFENEVDITKSSWKMDMETLLSEIGGFIGLNKNFLWILTLFLSTMGIIGSNLKLKIMPKTLGMIQNLRNPFLRHFSLGTPPFPLHNFLADQWVVL